MPVSVATLIVDAFILAQVLLLSPCDSQVTTCGGTIYGEVILTSPNYPDLYPNDAFCMWTLVAPIGFYYKIQGGILQLERHHDFVHIYWGTTPNGVPNMTYSGEGDLSAVKLMSEITVVFVSDGSMTGRGFRLPMILTSLVYDNGTDFFHCGGYLFNEGNITSPGYDQGTDYEDYSFCTWTLTAPPGYSLLLQCASFYIEDRYDYVYIFNSSNLSFQSLSETYTGEGCFSPLVLGQVAVVVFTSDYSVATAGFQIYVTSLPTSALPLASSAACGGVMTNSGTITSPGFPSNYYNGALCVWHLKATDGNIVQLNFLEFYLETAYDYLYAYSNGNGSGIPSFTFTGWPYSLANVSVAPEVTLVFTSDKGRAFPGFILEFTSVSSALAPPVTDYTFTACGGNVTANQDIWSPDDPDSPGYYPQSAYCQWNIRTPCGHHAILECTENMGMDSTGDFLYLYNSTQIEMSNLYATITNSDCFSLIEFQGDATVVFVSDSYSLKDEEGIQTALTFAFAYQVVESIVPVISGGDATTITYGTEIFLQAVLQATNITCADSTSSDYRYIWQCRRLCESWAIYDATFSSIISLMNSSCGQSRLIPGCYLDSTRNSGSGTLHSNDSDSFSLNTSELIMDSALLIRVIVVKGNISGEAYQQIIFLSPGALNVTLQCLSNCAEMLNPNDRLTLHATVSGYDELSIVWDWSLSIALPDSTFSVLPEDSWLIFAPTGKTTSSLSISRDFWLQQNSTSKIAVVAKATASGFTTNSSGIAFYVVVVSALPDAGNCSITPNNGTAITTRFNISCTNFNTSNPPLTYQVGYSTDGSSYSWVRSGKSLKAIGTDLLLPFGLPERAFSVYVTVSAVDNIGMLAEANVTVQVLSPQSTQLSSVLTKISTAGDLSAFGFDSTKPAEAISFIGALALTLNSIDITSKKNDTSISLNDAINVREVMTSILGKVPMTDTVSLIGVQSTLSNVLSISEQVSSKAQNTSADVLQNGATAFATLSNSSTFGGQRQTAMTAIISSAGNLVSSTAYAVTNKSQVIVDTSVRVVSAIETIANTVWSKAVPNEEDVTASTTKLTMTLSKKYISKNKTELTGDDTGNGIVLPDIGLEVSGISNLTVAQSQVSVFADNPYAAASKNTSVDSGVVMVSTVLNDRGTEVAIGALPKPLHVLSERGISLGTAKISIYGATATGVNNSSFVHKIKLVANQSIFLSFDWYYNISTKNSSVANETRWNRMAITNHSMVIYLAIDRTPSAQAYDFNCTLPLITKVNQSTNTTEIIGSGVYSTFCRGNKSLSSSCRGEHVSKDEAFFPNGDAQGTELKQCYIPAEYLSSYQAQYMYATVQFIKSSMTAYQAKLSNPSGDTEAMTKETISYEGYVYTQPCFYWNRFTLSWITEGCLAGPLTSLSRSHCLCTRVSVQASGTDSSTAEAGRRKRTATQASPTQAGIAIGSGISISVNAVNLKDSAFNHLDENPLVFTVMFSIICIYLCVLIWAIKQDKLDESKAAVIPLPDNDLRDKYLYEVIIYTGSMASAGTSAIVCMTFSGDDDTTQPRIFLSTERQAFQRGGIDCFLMAVPKPLGALSYIRVWHDNSGRSPSWFLSRVVVVDIETSQKFYFVVNKWLSEVHDDCLRCRIVNVAGRGDLTTFGNMFWMKVRKDLADGHVWFSVLGRPHTSRFSRFERATCCLCLLFSLMTANIMFYGKLATSDIVIKIGPITFSVAQILQGIIASLVVLPINIIIVQLFRKTEPLHVRKILKLRAKSISPITTLDSTSQPKASTSLGKEPPHEPSGIKYHAVTSEERSVGAWRLVFDATTMAEYDKALQRETTNLRKAFQSNKASSLQLVRISSLSRKRLLPWWCVIFAYLICVATCGVSFWYVIEIGNVLGPESATKWLVSFLTSVTESVFLSQPIKVIVLAVVFSLVIKRPAHDEDSVVHRGKRVQYRDKHSKELPLSYTEAMQAIRQKLGIPGSPSKEAVQEAEDIRRREQAIHGVLREIGLYLLFVVLMMMRSYGNLDINSERGFRHNENTFRYSLPRQTNWIGNSLDKVHDYKGIWNWMSMTVVPSLYCDTCDIKGNAKLAGERSARSGFILVGQPLLRQYRIRKGMQCGYITANRTTCYGDYRESIEDTQNYNQGFIDSSSTTGGKHVDAWIWSSGANGSRSGVSGIMGSYPSTGYAISLGNCEDEAQLTLSYLSKVEWLDKKSRSLTVEFTTYNPNANLISSSFIIIELTPLGVVMSTYSMLIMRYELYQRDGLAATLVAEIGSILIALYLSYQEIVLFRRLKRKYFQSPSNVLNMVTLAFCLAAILLFATKIATLQEVKARVPLRSTLRFFSFQTAAYWSECYRVCLGLTTFLATLKFLRLLRFNNRISMLTTTIRRVMSTILAFLVMLGVIFFAFAHMTTLIFGSYLDIFSTYFSTCQYLLVLMMNKFDYVRLQQANPIYAPVLLLTFVIVINFTMLNIMMAMLMDGFQDTRAELKNSRNKHDLLQYIVQFFGRTSGLAAQKKLSSATVGGKRWMRVTKVKTNRLEQSITSQETFHELNAAFARLQKSISRFLSPNVAEDIAPLPQEIQAS